MEEEEKEDITKVPTLRIRLDNNIVATFNKNQVASLTLWLKENISLASDDF